jgi:phage N-6-adenine-methyltransferase
MARRPITRAPHGYVVPGLTVELDRPLVDSAAEVRSKSIINTATRGDEEKQRIATPWAFIHALEQRFGVPVDFDLAADVGNTKAGLFYTAEDDALKQDWSTLQPSNRFREEHPDVTYWRPSKLAYLNPPFANIKPWARKLAECRWLRRWTVMLVPASFSTDWFLELEDQLHRDAIPRIQFEGNDHLYPKDLALCVAGFGMTGDGYWDWRVSYAQYFRERGFEPDPVHMKGVSRLPAKSVFPDYGWTPSPFEG